MILDTFKNLLHRGNPSSSHTVKVCVAITGTSETDYGTIECDPTDIVPNEDGELCIQVAAEIDDEQV